MRSHILGATRLVFAAAAVGLLQGALPPEHRRGTGHQARWLWRTMRGAELAGLDPARILAEAIAERDLAGSRDLAAVLDARIRYRLGTLIPRPLGRWEFERSRLRPHLSRSRA